MPTANPLLSFPQRHAQILGEDAMGQLAAALDAVGLGESFRSAILKLGPTQGT